MVPRGLTELTSRAWRVWQLCSLRIAMVGLVEAVQACSAEQATESFVNLNMPRLRNAFKGPARQQSKAARQMSSVLEAGGVERPSGGFAPFSDGRHMAILAAAVQHVAAFLPLPFLHDPLLLHWFDEVRPQRCPRRRPRRCPHKTRVPAHTSEVCGRQRPPSVPPSPTSLSTHPLCLPMLSTHPAGCRHLGELAHDLAAQGIPRRAACGR